MKERIGLHFMQPLIALTKIDYATVFLACLTILAGLLAAKKIVEEFCSWLGLETKWRHRSRRQQELLEETIEKVYDLEKQQEEFSKNRAQDREQSLIIQKKLVTAIEQINQKLDESQRKTNKRVQAELKERLGQSYRYYHSIKQWNEMEKEAFDGLIEEYEEAGGNNSFVHDIVMPESYTWELVERK